MNRFIKYFFVFIMGAVLYALIEIIWRGHTHISMFFAGGICFLALYFIESNSKRSLGLKCLFGMGLITAVELIFGVVFNIILKMEVWDYSQRPLNLMGQICPEFSLIWFVLCIPAFALCRYIDKLFDLIRKKIDKEYI